jgi:peptide/nickel transport system substrate-binding protein
MPSTGFAVDSRAENRPGSLKQAITKAAASASPSRITRQSGRITLSASLWLSTPGGPSLRVMQWRSGPPGMRSGAIASSIAQVTASVEFGLITRMRSDIRLIPSTGLRGEISADRQATALFYSRACEAKTAARWLQPRRQRGDARDNSEPAAVTLNFRPFAAQRTDLERTGERSRQKTQGGNRPMRQRSRVFGIGVFAAVGWLVFAMLAAGQAAAQKSGGVLKIYHRDSPASMSILEEGTNSTEIPMMGVFNNLVMYDQHVAQNSLSSIVPDLATDWSTSEDATQLTFHLRAGVKWHDGEPFTAKDVQCTWEMLIGKSNEKLRLNPRKSWYNNIREITTNGDYEATFVLKRPQPALIALLASGYAPVYPCHVPARDMRSHPIGTGPFKFVEFKPNESIKVVRNPNYWKQGRPYLDGIEYTIIPNRSTAILAFIAGKFDMTFPFEVSIPLLKDIKNQAPQAICDLVPGNASTNLIVNRDAPPFDNPEIRRAMALSLDRKSFIDILAEGQGDIGGAMQPPPAGIWGLPPELLKSVPGYGPDVEENRAQARQIMQKLGYGPDHRLNVTISARNIAIFRDPGVILIDQLKDVYIDGALDPIETANWFPRVTRKDYQVGMNNTGSGVDDPDQQFYENYGCGSERNYTAIATPSFRRSSTGNRWKRTRKSAASWCGKSTGSCRRTGHGRSSITSAPRPAGSRV